MSHARPKRTPVDIMRPGDDGAARAAEPSEAGQRASGGEGSRCQERGAIAAASAAYRDIGGRPWEWDSDPKWIAGFKRLIERCAACSPPLNPLECVTNAWEVEMGAILTTYMAPMVQAAGHTQADPAAIATAITAQLQAAMKARADQGETVPFQKTADIPAWTVEGVTMSGWLDKFYYSSQPFSIRITLQP
jgi:hypothetical protein